MIREGATLSGLVGRRAERAAVERVLVQARAGRSGALVVRGEAGIGKTALLEQAREAAMSSGFRVESSVGVQAEAQFAFAGLHQLCSPLLGRLGELPDPQQAALGVAFGLRAGPAPDRFLVGLATLTLVAEVAEEAPLLCLVDDAQWLDEASAQVLAFVPRRVSAERVALLFGLRDAGAGGDGPFAGLPELRLTGLGDADALALLAAAVRTPLDDGVRDRVVAEARGNPWRCWMSEAATRCLLLGQWLDHRTSGGSVTARLLRRSEDFGRPASSVDERPSTVHCVATPLSTNCCPVPPEQPACRHPRTAKS